MKPQDLVILLKVSLWKGERWTQHELARSVAISASEVNHSLKRLAAAKLYDPRDRRVMTFAFLDLLTYAVKHVFPAELGPVRQGVPTSHAGPVLAAELVFEPDDVYVWPDSEGEARGHTVAPLYPSAPEAARNDRELYELLTLVDALRIGQAREVNLAKAILRERLVGARAA